MGVPWTGSTCLLGPVVNSQFPWLGLQTALADSHLQIPQML